MQRCNAGRPLGGQCQLKTILQELCYILGNPLHTAKQTWQEGLTLTVTLAFAESSASHLYDSSFEEGVPCTRVRVPHAPGLKVHCAGSDDRSASLPRVGCAKVSRVGMHTCAGSALTGSVKHLTAPTCSTNEDAECSQRYISQPRGVFIRRPTAPIKDTSPAVGIK